jgi:serine/threonine protein kinase
MQRLDVLEGESGAKYILALNEAVDVIHRAGIIHHDLSPSNLMLDQQGLIRIIDFGRAGYIGKKIPRCKRMGRETATNFSVGANLSTLEKTIGKFGAP